MVLGECPCACPRPDLELVEVSIGPGLIRTARFRCVACDARFRTETETGMFTRLPDDLVGPVALEP